MPGSPEINTTQPSPPFERTIASLAGELPLFVIDDRARANDGERICIRMAVAPVVQVNTGVTLASIPMVAGSALVPALSVVHEQMHEQTSQERQPQELREDARGAPSKDMPRTLRESLLGLFRLARSETLLSMVKTPKRRASLEIFAQPPYRSWYDHDSFRPRFRTLFPLWSPRLPRT
jgi:hypothetical protein